MYMFLYFYIANRFFFLVLMLIIIQRNLALNVSKIVRQGTSLIVYHQLQHDSKLF